MRTLFFLVLICISVIETQAQTYTSGLTATGSGSATNVRLGGANPLLVNTTVDLGTSFTFGLKKSTANYFTVLNNGNIGIGTITPTSLLHLKAGTTTLNTAPLKFTSGVNLTTPEAGAMEFNGTSLFFTPSTLRKTIAFADLSNITGLLPATLGGTGLASFATGDMLYASAVNVLGKVAVGSNGQILTVVAGVPAWATPTAGPSGWGISGNAGTVAGTNFMGTTDNIDVVFKRNGVKSGLISTNNTGFGVSSLALNTTGTNNTATGANTLASNTIGYDNVATGNAALNANTSGHTNVATGIVALLSNTTGISNTATGTQALVFNLTGNYNVATGRGSLLNNNSGSDNVATGLQSLYNNSTGSNNVATGSYTLHANTTGSNNTAIGYRSNVSVGNLTNATAIGNYAFVSQSNSVILGSIAGVNGAAASTNVGIGNNAPTERLDVTGNLKFSGALMPNNTEGTTGQVLTSNGAGAAPTWATPAAVVSGWALAGNAATVPGTNFIGTTDAQRLVFKTNNTEQATILANGDVGIGTVPTINNGKLQIAGNNPLYPVATFKSGSFQPIRIYSQDALSFVGVNDGGAQSLYFENGNTGLDGNAVIIGNGFGTTTYANFNQTLSNFSTPVQFSANVFANGKVGIGTTNISDPNFKLFVEGAIRTRKIKVDVLTWPDYVFKPSYNLPSLNEVEIFLQKNNHLPDVPSATEVEKNGIDLGDNQAILLKKIEELTLYMIQLNKIVEALVKENELLQKKVNSNNK